MRSEHSNNSTLTYDHDHFLLQCKQNYFDGIFPADENIKQTKGYLVLKDIAQSYFAQDRYKEFESLLMEGQYFISLWASHLILEYGEPSAELKQKCLEQIEHYSENPLQPKVAGQEANWLNQYRIRNK